MEKKDKGRKKGRGEDIRRIQQKRKREKNVSKKGKKEKQLLNK